MSNAALPADPAAPPLHVSFVCTGNICRSPIARIVFEQRVADAGLTGLVRVSSAGTQGWHEGRPADERARRVLADAGYRTAHAATRMGADHLSADLVVALHSSHLEELTEAGVPPPRLRLLRSFDPDSKIKDTPDPYYGDIDDFRLTLRQVEASMPGLLGWARDRLA